MSKELDDLMNMKAKTTDPVEVDSDLKAASDLAKANLAQQTSEDNVTQKVIDRLKAEQAKEAKGNILGEQQGFSRTVSKSPYQPDVQIIPPPSSADQNSAANPVVPRAATVRDLSNLTESDILNLDFVDAKAFDIPAMLQVKPRDGNIRFRWVNFKNYEGGNYAMFKAIGFSNAKPEDVEGPLSEHLLKEDGTIKWFDVVLMKVPVLHLMGIYKKNIIKALMKVGRWQTEAIAQAKRTLEHDVGSDVLNALRKQDKKIEFYAPTVKEMEDQDKTFTGS
jgi:hypothetical protein